MTFSNVSMDFMQSGNVDQLLLNNPSEKYNSLAILSPHAGYMFSGDVAATAFNSVADKVYNNVIILSTSHTANFKGACITSDEDKFYETPFGNMKIHKYFDNDELFQSYPNYFKNDHTIEVLLPFIQKTINYETIVPIMIGDSDINHLKSIAHSLKYFFNDSNLFVISSDFSHYPSYDDAVLIDNETKDLILRKNSTDFINEIFNCKYNGVVTRMCGWSAYLVLLFIIEEMSADIEIKFLKYKNSGDVVSKDTVVGYHAISFIKKN
jgi:MEMO1 family protein